MARIEPVKKYTGIIYTEKQYTSNQKLWRIIRQPEGYYYEIRLAGIVIDRIKIEYPALATLKQEGLI